MKGWPSQTVQTFYGGRRHDLFGIADSVILHPAALLWVQNCSYGSLKAHRDAIEASPYIAYLNEARVSVQLWEWRKKKVCRRGQWFLRTQARWRGKWNEITEWEGPLDLYPKSP